MSSFVFYRFKRIFGLGTHGHHDKAKKEKKATIIAPDSGAVSIGDNVFEVFLSFFSSSELETLFCEIGNGLVNSPRHV